jgi:PEP-CTERM motif
MRSMNCAVRAAVLLGVCLFGLQAGAAMITLSDVSDNETSIAAADMSATIDFSVTGSTLTVSVDNLAASLRMTDIYFNASSDVASITLTSGPTNTNTGEALWAGSSSASTASFGTFDYVLSGISAGTGKNKQTGMVLAGGSAVFTFALTGSNLDANDFGVEATVMGANGAATFRTGTSGGTAAMGAQMVVTPEPATAAMLVMGLGILARVGRSRHSA